MIVERLYGKEYVGFVLFSYYKKFEKLCQKPCSCFTTKITTEEAYTLWLQLNKDC